MPKVSELQSAPALAPNDLLYVVADGLSSKLASLRVPTIAAMRAILAPTNGMSVEVTEEHRGGLFVFDTGVTAAANGGTTFNAEDTTTGSWVRRYSGPVDVRWFGAVAGADSTAAIQACADATGCVAIPYTDVPFEFSTFASARPTAFIAIHGVAKVKLLNGGGTFAVTFQHPECYWDEGILVDGNDASKGVVHCTTGADNSIVRVTAKDVTADLGSSAIISAVAISGCSGVRFAVEGRNFRNTGNANESVPRAVSIQDAATEYYGEYVRTFDFDCANVLAFSGTGTIDTIDIYRSTDNGAYVSGASTNLHIGTLVYRGSEEALVAIGGSVNVDNMEVGVGKTGWMIGVSNAKDVTVDSLKLWLRDDYTGYVGQTNGGIVRTRTGNTNTNSVTINGISGDFKAERLMKIDIGTIGRLTIIDNKARFHYDPVGQTVVNAQWMNFSGCSSFDFRNWDMTIVDTTANWGNESGTIIFDTNPPASVSRQSHWHYVDVSMIRSGARVTDAFFRGRPFIQNVSWSGLFIQTEGGGVPIGPYAREVGASNNVRDAVLAVPAAGYWNRGTDLALLDAGAGSNMRAKCQASGSPGTWAIYGNDGDRAFAGRVGSDGTATYLPTGWTSSTLGTGLYLITHNLNDPDYSIAVTPLNTGSTGMKTAMVYDKTSNGFRVKIYDIVGAAAVDNAFGFVTTFHSLGDRV